MVTPKVNSEIWTHLNRKVRTQDVRLQKSQALVCKAIVPQLQPDKNEEFKALCSNDHPVTDNLFGDDLGKVVPKYRALSIKIKNPTAENRLGMATSLRTTIMEELESRTIF